VIKIIRDWITTEEKKISPRAKNIQTNFYQEDYFFSVKNVIELFWETGDIKYVRYIHDPYGILLLLDPIGPKNDNYGLKTADFPNIKCQEYYEAVKNNEIEEIWKEMTQEEQVFALKIDAPGSQLPKTDIIREIAQENGLDLLETLDCWAIQPDPEAIAFALGADLAKTDGVTPMIGRPLNVATPTTIKYGIRFPGFIEKNLYQDSSFDLVHIHKDETLQVFNKNKKEISLSIDLSPLEEEMSFVLEGFASKDELFITDILAWDGLFLYRRPAIERLTMLWRFPEFFHERIIVRSWKDLENWADKYKEGVLFRNLNSAYNPTSQDSHIMIEGEPLTCALKVMGKKGGRDKTFLSCKIPKGTYYQLFEIPIKMDKKERGDVLEVRANGEVIQNLGKTEADSWGEVCTKWGLDTDYKKYFRNRRLPKAIWHEEV
jgi:hypothetical protein